MRFASEWEPEGEGLPNGWLGKIVLADVVSSRRIDFVNSLSIMCSSNARTTASRSLIIIAAAALTSCGESNTYVPPPAPKVRKARSEQITRFLETTGNAAAVNSTMSRECRAF
jgi:hypothetical protein